MGFLLGLYYGWAVKTLMDPEPQKPQPKRSENEPKAAPLPWWVNSIVAFIVSSAAFGAGLWLRAFGLSIPPDTHSGLLGGVNDMHRDFCNFGFYAFTVLAIAHLALAVIHIIGYVKSKHSIA